MTSTRISTDSSAWPTLAADAQDHSLRLRDTTRMNLNCPHLLSPEILLTIIEESQGLLEFVKEKHLF